ncbi:MAG: LemA family protein [Sphaerochaetaceae bacterium]|nr:LemA family protein [Spirochaetales bacterium]MDY3768573.1 LemA family protein [Sphaerochaetaceae bacterium]MDY5968090.1 LemA family protein [Sphaerochaetaceae bacterium]
MIIALIIIAVLVVLAAFCIRSYNNFVKLRNRIEESLAQLDVTLKKRFDLIPNLVETVKGYAAHEKETLEGVINARNSGLNASTLEDKDLQSKNLTSALSHLFAVAENYPELKANENFMSLQNSLMKIEDEILMCRKYYNAVVKHFNTATETFPSNIIASIFHFTRQTYLSVEESEKQNIKVQF